MADIELVIKIPEEEYRNICLMSKDGIGMALYDWVANGISLPKGHGDLIDRSKLVYDCSFNEYGCGRVCHCDSCSYHIIKETTINKEEIIIEADKGE